MPEKAEFKYLTWMSRPERKAGENRRGLLDLVNTEGQRMRHLRVGRDEMQ